MNKKKQQLTNKQINGLCTYARIATRCPNITPTELAIRWNYNTERYNIEVLKYSKWFFHHNFWADPVPFQTKTWFFDRLINYTTHVTTKSWFMWPFSLRSSQHWASEKRWYGKAFNNISSLIWPLSGFPSKCWQLWALWALRM